MSCLNYAMRLSKNENKGPVGKKEFFETKADEVEKVHLLLDKIKQSNYIIVHAGAGISTSSGVQDFRGPTGIWTNEFKRKMKKKRSVKAKEKTQLTDENVKQVKKPMEDLLALDNLNGDGTLNVCNNVTDGAKKNLELKDSEENVSSAICEETAMEKHDKNENPQNSYTPKEDKQVETLRCNTTENEQQMENEAEQESKKKKRRMLINTFYEEHVGNSDDKGKEMEEVHSLNDVIEDDENAQNYVKFGNRKKKVVDLHLALPSKTHIMIKELMNKNVIKYLIIQNIDSLHYRAGIPFSKTSEIHGNIFAEKCDFCGRRYLRDFVIPTISFSPTGYVCHLCSFPPIGICTDVLVDWNDFYEPFFHTNSIKHSQKADFHFCLGSSFYIVPASFYPSKKKFANKNSYCCLINYQKSFLAQEANLNIHSNVNDVSDTIMKHFRLNPLSIRKAKIIIVRCPLHSCNVLCESMIQLYDTNDEEKQKEATSTQEIKLDIKTESDEHAKKSATTNLTTINSEEQTFLLKCTMIKHIKIPNHWKQNTYVEQIDKLRGIWIIKIKETIWMEIELWYGSFALIKLFYDATNFYLHFNVWEVNVAYNFGEDLDSVDLMRREYRNIQNFKNFSVTINEYVKWTYVVTDGKKKKKVRKKQFNEDTGARWQQNWEKAGNECKTKGYGQLEMNIKQIETDSMDYQHSSTDLDLSVSQNSNEDSSSMNMPLSKNKKHIESQRRKNNDENHIKAASQHEIHNINYEKEYTKNLEEKEEEEEEEEEPRPRYLISEIINKHVHVGFNPNDIVLKSKMRLVAYSSNSIELTDMNHKNYCLMEMEEPFNLMYNLFCFSKNGTVIEETTETEEKDVSFSQQTKIKETAANIIPEDIDEEEKQKLYSDKYDNMTNKKESSYIQNRYPTRKRKKTNMHEYSSDTENDLNDNKNKSICYTLYMDAQEKEKNEKEGIKKEKNTKKKQFILYIDRNGIHNILHRNNSDSHYTAFDNSTCVAQNEPKVDENQLQMEKTSVKEYIKEEILPTSPILISSYLLLHKKAKLGELVYKVPKYIKPDIKYTPYKKLQKNKTFNNALQKWRCDTWSKIYNNIMNNTWEECQVDSVFFREVSYFPFWCLNYINDLFECM